jgi:Protein of unknown function (DUF2628)
VLEASSARADPATADPEALRSSLRAFGRQRAETGDAAAQDLARDQDVPEQVLPLDSTKTFVGPNSNYYDETWRWMEWRQRNRSWNWPAAVTMGGWLAYRRLYDHAVLYSAWLTLLVLLALSGTPIKLLGGVQLVVVLLHGLYGNALYRNRFREAAETAARHDGDYPAQLAVLAAAGGTDTRAVWLMGLAMAAVIAFLAAFRRSLDGIHLAL